MLMTYAVGPKYLDFLENEKLHLFLGAKFNSKTHLLTPFLKTFWAVLAAESRNIVSEVGF